MSLCRVFVVTVGVTPLFWAPLAQAQCTKDTDCKGDRVCRNGACEDPLPPAPTYLPSADQPVAPVTTPPAAYESKAVVAPTVPGAPFLPNVTVAAVQQPTESQWSAGYAVIAGVASTHAFSTEGREHAGGGGYAAGYWAPNPLFHLGGFFHFYEAYAYPSNSVQGSLAVHYGVGASLKIGGCPSEHTWIGLVTDLGVHIASGEHTKEGLHLFPRLEVDGQVGRNGRFKVGLFGSFGPMVALGIGGYVGDESGSMMALQGLVGVMVGG